MTVRSMLSVSIVFFINSTESAMCSLLIIFSFISGYETSAHQKFKKEAGRLPLPSTEAAFQQYKHAFNTLFGLSLPEELSLPQEITEDVLEPQLLCIAQLRKYVGYINQQQKIKKEKKPTFFTENNTLLLSINNQLEAIEKTIAFLRGGSESDLQFTSEEIAILGKGFIGDTLGEILISLPSDSSQQLGP